MTSRQANAPTRLKNGPTAQRSNHRRAAAVLLLVAGLLACSGSTAWAKPLSCGDTVTTDTTLRADLTGCPAEGLLIGADRITLDLNGHTISGSFSGAAGIDNSAGHDGVTIKNGTVRNFTNGVVLLEHATGNRVQRLTLASDNSSEGADNGVLIFDSDHNRIERNSISGAGNGVFLGNTTDSTVDRNRVSGTDNGVYLLYADRNVVKRNALSNLVETGIFVFNGADNVISDNGATGGEAGVFIEGDRNAVSGNHLTHLTAVGIDILGDHNIVVGNSIADVLAGCDGCGVGISVDSGTGNLLAGNHVARTVLEGVLITTHPGDTPPTIGTVVRRNLVRAAGTDGIAVATDLGSGGPAFVTDTLLKDNVVIGSAHDGIKVASVATTLTRNAASRNGNLGIEAVPGVTDGGGNHAFGNGNPLQCSSTIAC
jgi:parallel beta-helix repeat protein